MYGAMRGMPELSHWPGREAGEAFDMMKSEVVEWLVGLVEVRQHIFDVARDGGRVIFDEGTRKWRGVGGVEPEKGVAVEGVKRVAGRPSKVEAVKGMDFGGYWGVVERSEVEHGKVMGANWRARFLARWLRERGHEVSVSTAKRVLVWLEGKEKVPCGTGDGADAVEKAGTAGQTAEPGPGSSERRVEIGNG